MRLFEKGEEDKYNDKPLIGSNWIDQDYNKIGFSSDTELYKQLLLEAREALKPNRPKGHRFRLLRKIDKLLGIK